MQGKLVLIIGPSGVGKSVILTRLRQSHPEFHFPRSATTRPRRPSEGDDLYHFVDDHAFDSLLQHGKILEWATVHGGARYGTLVDEIMPSIDAGKIVIREVDVQGFDSIARSNFFAQGKRPLQSIFILPESMQQLIAHITKRSAMDHEELQRRIASVEKELAYASQCTARVVNAEGKLEETIKEVERMIETADHGGA